MILKPFESLRLNHLSVSVNLSHDSALGSILGNTPCIDKIAGKSIKRLPTFSVKLVQSYQKMKLTAALALLICCLAVGKLT